MNDWYARHARRILHERYPEGAWKNGEKPSNELLEWYRDMIQSSISTPDVEVRLKLFWTLHEMNALAGKSYVNRMVRDTSPNVNAWSVRLGLEKASQNEELRIAISFLAEKSESPIVRRAIASALQKLPAGNRVEVLKAMIQYSEDATDPVLPQLYWYALEPLCAEDPANSLQIAAKGKIPQLLTYAARRVGSLNTVTANESLVQGLNGSKSSTDILAYLLGLQESVKGKRQAEAPKGWANVSGKFLKSEDSAVRNTALALAVTYGDTTAFNTLRNTLSDTTAELATRQSALASLLDARDKHLPAVLQQLLSEPAMRPLAIRALASFDDSKTPVALSAIYKTLTPAEKRDAIATLSSRVAFAQELLAGLAAKTIPHADVPAETIRQLRNLNDKALNEKIASVWGLVRDTPADRKKLIGDWSQKLNPAVLAKADLGAGRAIYSKVCMQCHTLYGVGGKVGPEITGANRSDLNYLLENIFDPSAVIPKEYAAIKFDLLDGRVITGILKEENQATLTVVTATETLTLRATDVDKRTPSELSMMPDDITKPLSDTQIRDLLAYLKFNTQVPILGDAENAKEFFNGKDLTGWDFDKDVWSVDDGEIVGKTKAGLKANNFVKSTMDLKDFRLTLKTKLTPNTENSGIQFRSVPIEKGEMRGPQADMGKGWWGKLYEESGRGLLVKEGGEKFVKEGEWNDYIVEAIGPKVKLWINGNLICDYEDDKLAKRGVIAFQVHSGGPMEVRFKDIKLEVIEAKK